MSASTFSWPKNMRWIEESKTSDLTHDGKMIYSDEVNTSYATLGINNTTQLLLDLGATYPSEEKTPDDNSVKITAKTDTGSDDSKDAKQDDAHDNLSGAAAVKNKTKRVFYDLGAGKGRVVLQSFLEFTTLTKCVGIEIVDQRYAIAERNLSFIAKNGYKGRCFKTVEKKEGKTMTIKEELKQKNGTIIERICKIWCGSIFDFPNGIKDADICHIAVIFPSPTKKKVIIIFIDCKPGCTIAAFEDLLSYPDTNNDKYLILKGNPSFNKWDLKIFQRV